MSEREEPYIRHPDEVPDEHCRVAKNLAEGPKFAQQGVPDHKRIFEGIQKPPGTIASDAVTEAYDGVGGKAYEEPGLGQRFLDWLSNKDKALGNVGKQLQAEAKEKCGYEVADLGRK